MNLIGSYERRSSNHISVAVWAETGEFRDSGHSSLASGGSEHQPPLYAPPRPRRDRKHNEDNAVNGNYGPWTTFGFLTNDRIRKTLSIRPDLYICTVD
ncbi:hypothetical protein EVAR_88660_1 [Eumeta japonica]|uniref:Uncharacterized protein n=1 Tax=Eumeta variegata TaxID=151549 RepID=A0A4C1Y7A9_EUMVA|nr:hypothetical protein EVAR_88660_1 [Eumeta japonica]